MHSQTLQEPLAQLYRSADLGVVLANEEQVFDANDAALRMFGFTREEMLAGKLSWKELTPPEYVHLDRNALRQMRDTGSCVPFEKEFILRDGTRFPFVIGAVRLTEEPMTWAAYVLSLRENRLARQTEQNARELKTKAKMANELAHELNNPLAGLTFIVHLLKSRAQDGDGDDSQRLLSAAAELVERISSSVQRVLAVTRTEGD